MSKYLNERLTSNGYPISNLEELEFAVGSCGLSRRQALIELGFPEENIDELMAQRVKEDEGKREKIQKSMDPGSMNFVQ